MEEGEVCAKPNKRKREKGKQAKKPQKRFKKKEEPSMKKVPCKFFIEGRCNKGQDCIFSHNVAQIHKPELCKFFLTNCCAKGDSCVYSHNTKSFPCKYMHANGHCQSASDCRFSHERLKCAEIPKFLEENWQFLKDLKGRGGAFIEEFVQAMEEEQRVLD